MKRKYVNRLPKGAEVKGYIAHVENGEIIVEVELKDRFQPKDGDFLVSSTGNVFIYSDEKAQNDNLYCCYCGVFQSSKLILTHFSNCWTKKEGCRFATPKEKADFLKRLETEERLRWNADNKKLEPIRWKPKNGEKFYYIDVNGKVRACVCRGFMNFFDVYPNCFKTDEAAQKVADQIINIFKNAKAE